MRILNTKLLLLSVIDRFFEIAGLTKHKIATSTKSWDISDFYITYYTCSIKREGGVRFVTLPGFSMGRVSSRRSRFYDVAGGSPYLPDEEHNTVYQREHSCRQAATSRNVEFGLLFRKNAAYVIIGENDDPRVVGVVSPRTPRNDLRSTQSFLKILRAHVERLDVWSR